MIGGAVEKIQFLHMLVGTYVVFSEASRISWPNSSCPVGTGAVV